MSVTAISYKPLDDLSLIVGMLRASCTDGSKKFSIYGGAPRDMLRGEPIRDIDVYIQDYPNVANFVKFLVDANRLRKQIKREGHYSLVSLEIQASLDSTAICLVDVTTQSNRFHTLCDFTCNNLIFGSDGTISTRVPPPPSLNVSSFEWTGRCIQDAIHGRLSCMVAGKVTSPASYLELREHLLGRIAKFVDKGYQVSEHLSEVGLKKIKTHVPDDAASSCPICKDVYQDNDKDRDLIHEGEGNDGVVLKCKHHFHFKCINEWVKASPSNNRCPVCRAVIRWVFE
jgi:hypothetical protein